MAALPGAKRPRERQERLSPAEHDDELTLKLGVEWATLQCRQLLEQGAPGIHFYTLNRSPATRRVFRSLLEK